MRDRPLPADGTMRGPRFGRSFRGGAAQASLGQLRRGDSIEVAWPPSWTCLAAVARSRGLPAKPSEPGLAAVTLLHSLGSIDEVGWLLHPPLIDLLYRLGERSGMSWWKKRWTHTHKQLRALGVDNVDNAVLEQAARDLGRDDPAIAPAGEGRDLAFAEFRTALGGDAEAASRWVQWAERRHLLVRGAPVECTAGGARSWLPMGALPPPVVCAGCGREIDQPFPPSGLSFTYRLGEPLRRVLETDSLGHLLAVRWFTELFGNRKLSARSSISMSRLRACWVVQAPSGLVVVPRM
ncbi:hypothetical protein [Saccharothrix sp. ALI-22-I]|uniref:hypothetical protein n=1 Tax=Saccharothrix sp. ALI-22-I TaxID=1933778 RepID=UPI00097BB8F7|nr:hypothetical protein [Saccharothrix sp. ALI-22-I]